MLKCPIQVFSIVAVAMYESGATWLKERPPGEHTYEAFLIIAIILALVVLVVTCHDIKKLTGKTFLVSFFFPYFIFTLIYLFFSFFFCFSSW